MARVVPGLYGSTASALMTNANCLLLCPLGEVAVETVPETRGERLRSEVTWYKSSADLHPHSAVLCRNTPLVTRVTSSLKISIFCGSSLRQREIWLSMRIAETGTVCQPVDGADD